MTDNNDQNKDNVIKMPEVAGLPSAMLPVAKPTKALKTSKPVAEGATICEAKSTETSVKEPVYTTINLSETHKLGLMMIDERIMEANQHREIFLKTAFNELGGGTKGMNYRYNDATKSFIATGLPTANASN